jgi:hypothetical protein
LLAPQVITPAPNYRAGHEEEGQGSETRKRQVVPVHFVAVQNGVAPFRAFISALVEDLLRPPFCVVRHSQALQVWTQSNEDLREWWVVNGGGSLLKQLHAGSNVVRFVHSLRELVISRHDPAGGDTDDQHNGENVCCPASRRAL